MLTIFSIRDNKAEAFIQPFFSPTAATAIRSFESAVNDSNTDFHKYAGDYTLFQLGEWEPNTGKITICETPINLGLAITFLHSSLTAEPEGR